MALDFSVSAHIRIAESYYKMNRPEYDEPTLAKWKSEVDEKNELLGRKRWLLLQHPDFLQELREVEKAAGKNLPLGRVLPVEMALDWKYLGHLDKLGTPRHAFIGKYELFPMQPAELAFELARLRKLAKNGRWGAWDKNTFNRQAWLFDLRQEGKTSREIAELTLRNKTYLVFLELQALSYWRKSEIQKFNELCRNKIARVPTVKQTQTDKLKLLYLLGRFDLSRAKGNLGWPAREFPPFDGDSRELRSGRQYLVHVDYEWPEQLFEKEPQFTCSEELQNLRYDYLWYQEQYLGKDSYLPIRNMIRKAIADMKKKINKLYEGYQENQ